LEKPSVLVQNRRKYKLSNSIKTEGFSRKTFCFFLKKTEKKLNRTEGNTRSLWGYAHGWSLRHILDKITK
jgi:hypothetical protein